jgi:leucyl aminopeptidase
MPLTLSTEKAANSLPVRLVTSAAFEALAKDAQLAAWAKTNAFQAKKGEFLLVPDGHGGAREAYFGVSDSREGFALLATGRLARLLPEGDWHLEGADDAALAALGAALGAYAFLKYAGKSWRDVRLHVPGIDTDAVQRRADAVTLVRDLINTPTNDLLPSGLEEAARKLAQRRGADIEVTTGDDLLAKNYPMIHAVGRASSDAPRLIDMRWGRADAPKLTLVGKGVCFDTGGLDIKPASNMVLMKKDMGGAANVLGLADLVMGGRLDVRLRVLVPAVENAISGNAFRPGDVLRSRKGFTVEIGNTDAEGRLVLADALALGDEEAPQMMIDMATLTGAARVALGPDLPPFFTDDEALATDLAEAGVRLADPVWRLPLWKEYDSRYSSKVADFNNVNTDGFAGAITAALFLRRFVDKASTWAHFDIYGWNPLERPHAPVGGEAQAIRAIEDVLFRRFAG